jgi:hypothetical protein
MRKLREYKEIRCEKEEKISECIAKKERILQEL